MKNILFVCRFNRYRSQFAESFFKKYNTNPNLNVRSAGLIKGKPLDLRVTSLAKKYNLDLKGTPESLSEENLDWQDMIVVVAQNVPVKVFDDHRIKTEKIIVWKIEEEEAGAKDIKRNVLELIQSLND